MFPATCLRGLELTHRHKTFHLFVRASGALELHVDHCLRKRRESGPREPQYVWTNIELEWEEHHYIEARYWRGTGELLVTVNGDELHRGPVPEFKGDCDWLPEDVPAPE
jgi:hypothetical protein